MSGANRHTELADGAPTAEDNDGLALVFANSPVSPRRIESSSPLQVIMIETYGGSCKAERDGSSLVKSD